MGARPSPSMEWLVEHYLDNDAAAAETTPVVVPSPSSDFADLSYGATSVSSPSSTKQQKNLKQQYRQAATSTTSTHQHQRSHQMHEEPLSPVYVKQHRDDDIRTSPPHRHTPKTAATTPKASNALIQAFDDLRGAAAAAGRTTRNTPERTAAGRTASLLAKPPHQQQQPQGGSIQEKRTNISPKQQHTANHYNNNNNNKNNKNISNIVGTNSSIVSAISGMSSSVLSNDLMYPAMHPTKPSTSLSLVLSEVTEEEPPFHQRHPPQQQKVKHQSPRSNHHSQSHTARTTTTTTIDVQHHSILELCTEDLMSDDAQIVRLALDRLVQICNKEQGIQFTQFGGHAMLVGVMKKFHTQERILIPACTLVRTLVASQDKTTGGITTAVSVKTEQSDGNCNAFAELFLAVNGLECILRLMEYAGTGDEQVSVRAHAAGALTQLLQVSRTSMERFLQTNHTYTFLRIIREQRLSTNGMLCRLLYQLSTKVDATGAQNNKNNTNNSNRMEVTMLHQEADRAVDLIVAELNECPDSRSVQVYGCATLGNIFKKTPEYGNEGIPAILRAMKLFGNDEIVLERAITGLFYCCRIPRHVDMLKHQSGGLSTVSLALECFPKNAVIQSRGSEIIKALLSSPKRARGVGQSPDAIDLR